jgi:hypothetical protein
MAKKNAQRIVEIEWEDSAGYNTGAWVSKHERIRPLVIHSVGYVHREDKRTIELAPHISPEQTCGNMSIPRTAIRKLREL